MMAWTRVVVVKVVKDCWILDLLLIGYEMREETEESRMTARFCPELERMSFKITVCMFYLLFVRNPIIYIILYYIISYHIAFYSLITFHLCCVNSPNKCSVVNLDSSPGLSPHSSSSFIE